MNLKLGNLPYMVKPITPGSWPAVSIARVHVQTLPLDIASKCVQCLAGYAFVCMFCVYLDDWHCHPDCSVTDMQREIKENSKPANGQ